MDEEDLDDPDPVASADPVADPIPGPSHLEVPPPARRQRKRRQAKESETVVFLRESDQRHYEIMREVLDEIMREVLELMKRMREEVVDVLSEIVKKM